MRSSHSLDRLEVAFDGTQLVADAGLLLPATLAQHLGVKAIVEEYLDLGSAPGAPNPGDKLLTLVASALAGGDCIDDAAALRSGGTNRVLGFTVKAASTLGTFLRSFRWGHVRQLGAMEHPPSHCCGHWRSPPSHSGDRSRQAPIRHRACRRAVRGHCRRRNTL